VETSLKHIKALPFLLKGGEMGKLILQHDWQQSAPGSMDKWPMSLLTTLGNMLHSAFPMFLFWGEELTCFYNDAYRPSLGTNGKHPAIGKRGKEIWPEIWDFIGPLIEKVMTTGEPSWFQDQLVPIYRNGHMEDVYWTFSYSPAYGDKGNVEGVLVTCMETTQAVIDRKMIEQVVTQTTEELHKSHLSLIEANKYLQKLINFFKEPMQVLAPVWENGKIIDFTYKLTNAAYSVYANMKPEELTDRRVSEVFPGYLETSSFFKNVETFMTGIPDTWDIHYNQDGLDLYNKMSATKIDKEIVVHFTDFTTLKHLQLELEKKIVELERSNKHLEEFTHAASHDLKEPIRKINIFTAMLKSQLGDQLKDREKDTLERIQQASLRMGTLVDDLLLYSHVSLQPHENEKVDLNEVLAQVIEVLDLEIEQKSAVINISRLPTVHGFRRQLQQLFQNLVSNALKYSKENVSPVVEINTFIAEDNGKPYHVIQVVDNGIGFEQEYAEKIFQMFTRLHTKSAYAGTGVGLSIARQVATNHKGSIGVESKKGEGTTFRVYLPV
jgi:signal transduction histidine kinase